MHMLSAKRRELRAGFTIVELIVVIVAIAILATLVIVSYNGIQERARDTVTETDIANFEKDIHLHSFRRSSLPASLAQMQSGDFAGVDKMTWGLNAATRDSYGVSTYSDNTGYNYAVLYYWSHSSNHWMAFSLETDSSGSDWKTKRDDGWLFDPVTGERPCRAESLSQCTTVQ